MKIKHAANPAFFYYFSSSFFLFCLFANVSGFLRVFLQSILLTTCGLLHTHADLRAHSSHSSKNHSTTPVVPSPVSWARPRYFFLVKSKVLPMFLYINHPREKSKFQENTNPSKIVPCLLIAFECSFYLSYNN